MAVGPSREELIEEARKRGIAEPEKLAPRELERIVSAGKPSQSFWSRFLGRVRGALGSEGSQMPSAERAPSPPTGDETTGDEIVSEEPIPTRTMAGLLAEQGHEERALAIYDRLLDRPTDHAAEVEAVTNLRASLKAERDAVHRRLEARSQEAQSPGPERRDRSPVVAVVSQRSGVLVAWDVPSEQLARAQAQLGSDATLTARMVIVRPDPCLGAEVETWERDGASTGEWVLGNLPTGTRVTSAIGYRRGPRFVSAAHSPVVEA